MKLFEPLFFLDTVSAFNEEPATTIQATAARPIPHKRKTAWP